MFSTVFIALLLSCCLSLASVIPLERRTTGVITQCTVPNTVALTFVRSFMFATSFDEADLKKKNFSPHFYRMMVHTSICTIYFFMLSQPAVHWNPVLLGRMLSTLSKKQMQKELSFSVREALRRYRFYSLLISIVWIPSLSDLDGHNCSFIPPVLEYHW